MCDRAVAVLIAVSLFSGASLIVSAPSQVALSQADVPTATPESLVAPLVAQKML